MRTISAITLAQIVSEKETKSVEITTETENTSEDNSKEE